MLPAVSFSEQKGKIALFDPAGETRRLFERVGVPFRLVEAKANLAGFDTLVIGKGAMSLEKLGPEHLRDWRGEATLVPPGMDSMLAGVGPADVHNRDPRVVPLVKGGANRLLKNAHLLRFAHPSSLRRTYMYASFLGISQALHLDIFPQPVKDVLQQADTVKVIGNGVLAEAAGSRVVFSQLAPWHFDHRKQMNLKRTFRRTAFLTSRLLANMGVSMETPLLSHFRRPVSGRHEKRWLAGLYLDTPEEWDYPYRFFRW